MFPISSTMSITGNTSSEKNRSIDLLGIKTPIIYSDKFEQNLVRHLVKNNPNRYNQFLKFVVINDERKQIWHDLKKRERLHITRHYSRGAEITDSQEMIAEQFIDRTLRNRDMDCILAFDRLNLETP